MMPTSKLSAAIAVLFLCNTAYAWNHDPSPPAKQDQTQKQTQSQGQLQVQNAVAIAKQSQSAKATADADATASADNNVTIAGDTQVRQAPSIAQGSFAIQGCGAAGNLGGANTHGAAFLGFGFTPDECYAFLLAQSYQAVGQTETACWVLNSTKAARRAAKRGVILPSCEPTTVPPFPQDSYTKQEVDQRLDAAFKRSQSK